MPRLTLENRKFILRTGTSRKVITVKEAARHRALGTREVKRLLGRVMSRPVALPSAPIPAFLDPHQADGVRWLLSRSRSYLAHAPGAGKTVQAIVGALWAGGKGQSLFIVPPSLTGHWAREFYRFFDLAVDFPWEWPSIAVVPLSADQDHMGWSADFIICPDSLLTKPWVLSRLQAMKKKFVAVDEASRFKEDTSARTRALFGGRLKDGRECPGLIRSARHAVLLDGSPMPNRPLELWAPVTGMAPETIDFMSKEAFGFKYCGGRINEYGRYEFKWSSHEAELKSRLQEKFMHVVGEEKLSHPERRRSMLIMSEDVRSREHKAWERENLGSLKISDISETNSNGDLAKFRRELGERKVNWVRSYVEDRLKTRNESILVFAWHRSVCEELARGLRNHSPGLIMGGTSKTKRERILREFQTGHRRLIIGNILAMGRGENLQRADRVIFAEFSWSDETNKQAEKRASRRGRAEALFVRCEYVVSPGSMDEPILTAVFNKMSMVKKVIG